MTEIEYLCGIALLLAGFNLGFRESKKGLQLRDFKKIYHAIIDRIKKQAA